MGSAVFRPERSLDGASSLVPYSGLTVIDLEQVADDIRATLPNVKIGPMRLWGQPMGRPGEDGHILVGCAVIRDCLRLMFTNYEVLAVWNPRDIEINSGRFRIASADEMRFTSYYCGRPMTPENILYRDYALRDDVIFFRTNEPWLHGGSWMCETVAAVEVGD